MATIRAFLSRRKRFLIVVFVVLAYVVTSTQRLSSLSVGMTIIPRSHHSNQTAYTTAMSVIPLTYQDPRPFHLRMVICGDSMSRFQYLSLVHFLKFGTWAEYGSARVEMHNTTRSWNEWFRYTNQQLQPYEQCDCYRNWSGTFLWNQHVENRYFADPSHDNYVTFLTKFGGYPSHGRWNVSTIYQNHTMTFEKQPFVWSYGTWEALIRQYVSQMSPRPQYFVFNSGFWGKHQLNKAAVIRALRQALEDNNMIGIYRTTTYRRDENHNLAEFQFHSRRKHDRKVCQWMHYCLNVSWTVDVPEEEYVDTLHFRATVNNRMSQQLLDLVSTIAETQKKI